MGYYLPNRSYLFLLQTTSLRTQIIFFTGAISIVAVIVIFTTIQLMNNYGAEAKNVNKDPKNISLMGTEKFIPIIENTGNIEFPAQLAFFIVEANDFTVDVKWATVSEYKNAYFVLERSYDNRDLVEVTRIEAHGTTKQSNDYS